MTKVPGRVEAQMGLHNRDLITMDDLTNPEIEAVFSLADEMSGDVRAQSDLCKGIVMASLFYEPSTRTRLSFETAMHRLGGNVVTAADVSTTSISKGESLADTARVVSSYVDIIVVRHPWEGAAKAIADYSGVPVVNAGDGSHEHPTQTLCDLYTLGKQKGRINELTVAICGDLKGGRTVHSLTYALARFGANIFFIPSKGYELPEYVKDKLDREYPGRVTAASQLDTGLLDGAELGALDAIYQTPAEPHQLALLTEVKSVIRRVDYDVLYATRLQRERHTAGEGRDDAKYVKVDQSLMGKPEFRETLVMHPLPRIDEIAYDMDEDPRSMYFKQAAYGVPIRMALLALLLGAAEPKIPEKPSTHFRQLDYPVYQSTQGIGCGNPTCVSNQEPEYLAHKFWRVSEKPAVLRCVYCHQEVRPLSAGSARTRVFHKAGLFSTRRLIDENLVYFESNEQARDQGFRPDWLIKEPPEDANQGDP